MPRLLGLAFAVALGFSGNLLTKDKPVTATGWISDANCGALHTQPGGGDCVRKCIKGGKDIGHPEWKPQRMVFVHDIDKKIWVILNPDILKGHEGQHLKINGQVDAVKNTVHVMSAVAADGLRGRQ